MLFSNIAQVVYKLLERGKHLDIKSALEVEYRIGSCPPYLYLSPPSQTNALLAVMRMVLTIPSFYEGVRAVIIDKDNKPRWNPGNLAAVDDTALSSLFKEFGAEEKRVYGTELFG